MHCIPMPNIIGCFAFAFAFALHCFSFFALLVTLHCFALVCNGFASLATAPDRAGKSFYEGILHDLNLLLQSRLIAKWASAKYGHLMACTVASCCRWCFSTTIQSRICISCTVVSHWCSALIQSLRFSTTIQSRAHSLSILTKIYGDYF